jgi:choice-of-anchor A domain-containing protein
VTIGDDDPEVAISVGDATVAEGDAGDSATLELTATLSAPSGREVRVAFATSDGSAHAGGDYAAATGTLVWLPGQTVAHIAVQVLGDALVEPDETFSVVLSSPLAATVDRGVAVVTVRDDDVPVLSATAPTVLEGDQGSTPLAFTVTLSSTSPQTLVVQATTVDGTALAGQDYEPISTTLTFAPGVTSATVTVPVLGDRWLEPNQTFVLRLEPIDSDLGATEAVGTIVDDELCLGPELLRNPGAEADLADGEIPGWTEVESTQWQRRLTPPPPFEGEATFFPGSVPLAELAQEVDVSAYAAAIDAGAQHFSFSGRVRTHDEHPPDAARLVVEYRDAAESLVLATFDSGDLATGGAWQAVSDLRVAPAGTRRIRVRLLATRFAPADLDAYFDALSVRSLRTLAIATADVEVQEPAEGSIVAPISVHLSCAVDAPVELTFATRDGVAVAGADYAATNGLTTVSPGMTTATINVPVQADDHAEEQESFFLDLVTTSLGVIVDATAEAAIVDPRGCVEEPLGVANGFNLFVFESLQQNSSQTSGRLAIGRDAQLNNYTVGLGLPGAGGNVLVVGRNLIFNQGTVRHGDVVYGQSATLQGVTIPEGTSRKASPIDFTLVRGSLEELSTSLGNLLSNGTVTGAPWNPLVLTGTDLTLNVFEVAGSKLTTATALRITVPEGSSVLVNVTGSSVVMQNFAFTLTGVGSDRVMLNLPQASHLVGQNITVFGTVLAPRASVQINNGGVRGTLVAKSLQGNGQATYGPFSGCLPLPGPETFCPRSPGYWKNHVSAWPVQQLQLGAAIYNQAGILSLLSHGGSDGASKLARALAATKLNQAAGFQHPALPATVQQADAFLDSYPPGSKPKGPALAQANTLKAQLEAYYEGVACD